MPDLNSAWCRVLMEELQRGGARFAVVCPGSRSTPLALAAAAHPGIRVFSVVDERSAGFFALGLAKSCGAPSILICTSGTAGAHFLPAVMEAQLTHVPLVVITADRPHELHGFGALQSVDQQHLFGRHAQWFVDLGVPEATETSFRHLRAVASRASSCAGVVHLNAPFREPLVPVDDLTLRLPLAALETNAFFQASVKTVPALESVAACINQFPRGIILVGPRDSGDRLPASLFRLAEHIGYPIVAESTSQCRWHPEARMVVSRMDALARHAPASTALTPDVVLRFGGPLTTRQMQGWLDASGARTVLFHEHSDIFDPNHSAHALIGGDPTDAVDRLVTLTSRRTDRAFALSLLAADHQAGLALNAALTSSESLTEPTVAKVVLDALPEGTQLFISNSMPIRDVDAFGGTSSRGLRVFCNRGAAGIDGITSTALGVAAASGKPTVLLTGDLSFIHDLGGLLTARRYGIPLVIVLVNNDGGGIFSFLPVSAQKTHFEELFGTPHGLDFSHAASLFGAELHRPTTVPALKAALKTVLNGGLAIVEARVQRDTNPAVHAALWQTVSSRLGEGPWH